MTSNRPAKPQPRQIDGRSAALEYQSARGCLETNHARQKRNHHDDENDTRTRLAEVVGRRCSDGICVFEMTAPIAERTKLSFVGPFMRARDVRHFLSTKPIKLKIRKLFASLVNRLRLPDVSWGSRTLGVTLIWANQSHQFAGVRSIECKVRLDSFGAISNHESFEAVLGNLPPKIFVISERFERFQDLFVAGVPTRLLCIYFV